MPSKDVALILSFDDKGTAKVKQVVPGVTKALAGLAKEGQKTTQAFKGMEAQVKKTTTAKSKFQSVLKSTGVQMMMGLGLYGGVSSAIRGMKNAVVDVITTGREFEREWANVTTMLSISEREADKMKWQLINLSPVLGDTTDLARGMYQVLSASVEPAKAIMFLGEAAKAAKAGVSDTKTAVDALTTVINAYGMEAEDVTKVSDIMFQTVKRGKLTYEGMAGAIGSVVPIASQVGVSFEEVGAAMATLTRQGVDVNTTTVQLRQVLVSVLKPTTDAVIMAKRLGIEFTATALKSKGLSGFLKEIAEKAGGDAEALTALFGNIRALTAVMGLAGTSAEEFAYDLELMGNAAGSTEIAFRKQMQSFDFWIQTAATSLDKMKVSFYQGLVEPAKRAIPNFKALETEQTSLNTSAKALGESVGGLGVALKLLLPVLQRKLQFLKYIDVSMAVLKSVLFKTTKPLDEFRNNLKDIAIAEREAAEALERRSFGMITIGTMMASSIKKLKVYRSELYLSGATHDEIREKLKGWLKTQNLLNKLTETATDNTKKLKEKLKSFGGVLREDVEKQLKEVNELFAEFKDKLSPGAVDRMRATILKLRKELGLYKDVIKEIIPKQRNLLDVQKQAVDVLFDWGTGTKYASERLGDLGLTIKDMIKFIKKYVAMIMFMTGNVTSEFIKMFNAINTKSKSTNDDVMGTWEAVTSGLAALLRAGADDAEDAWDQVKLAGATTIETIVGYLDSLDEKNKFTWANFLNIASGSLTTLAGKIGEFVSGADKSFAGLGAGIGKGLGGIVGKLTGIPGLDKIGGIVGSLIGGLFKKKEKKTEEQRLAENLDVMVKEMKKSLSEFGDITDATLEKIAKLRQEGVEGWTAVTLNFADVIRDAGINVDNFAKLTKRALSAVNEYKSGLITAAQAGDVLNDSFELLIEGAKDLGLEGSAAIVEFIKVVRKSGLEVPAVTEYVLEQLDRIPEALKSMIDNIRDWEIIPSEVWDKLEARKDTLIILMKEMESPINKFIENNRKKLNKWSGDWTSNIDKIKNLMSKELIAQFDDWAKVNKKTWKDIGEFMEANISDFDKLTTRYDHNVKVISRLLGEDLVNQFEKWMRVNEKGWEDLSLWLEEYSDKTADAVVRIERKLEGMSKVAKLTFTAMMASGRGLMETMKTLKGPLTVLLEKYKMIGKKVPGYLKQMIELHEKMELRPKLFEDYDNAMTIMDALGNSVFVTQSSFDALKGTLSRTAKEILGVSGSWKEWLGDMATGEKKLTSFQKNAILPMLTSMAQLAAIHGVKVPAWAQEVFNMGNFGMKWDTFVARQEKMAFAGVNTVRQLKDANKKFTEMKNSARQTEANTNKMVDLLRRIKDKLRKGAQEGALFRSPTVTAVAEGGRPEIVQPLDEYLKGMPVKGTNITPGAAVSPMSITIENNITPSVHTEIVPWNTMEAFIIKTVSRAIKDEKLLVHPKGVRPH